MRTSFRPPACELQENSQVNHELFNLDIFVLLQEHSSTLNAAIASLKKQQLSSKCYAESPNQKFPGTALAAEVYRVLLLVRKKRQLQKTATCSNDCLERPISSYAKKTCASG